MFSAPPPTLYGYHLIIAKMFTYDGGPWTMPSSGSSYSSNFQYKWTIQAPDTSCETTITFTKFNTEMNADKFTIEDELGLNVV